MTAEPDAVRDPWLVAADRRDLRFDKETIIQDLKSALLAIKHHLQRNR